MNGHLHILGIRGQNEKQCHCISSCENISIFKTRVLLYLKLHMYHYSYTMSSLETHSWSCFSYLKRSETDHGFLMVVQCMLGVNFILYEKNIACKYSVFNLWCETCDNKKHHVDIGSFLHRTQWSM